MFVARMVTARVALCRPSFRLLKARLMPTIVLKIKIHRKIDTNPIENPPETLAGCCGSVSTLGRRIPGSQIFFIAVFSHRTMEELCD
ncbi:MAG TPA: hypothetical protein VGT08_10035 [Terracidiphilus sp.]|nr:hypothetical protein [Terracidiphilus sp.]